MVFVIKDVQQQKRRGKWEKVGEIIKGGLVL